MKRGSQNRREAGRTNPVMEPAVSARRPWGRVGDGFQDKKARHFENGGVRGDITGTHGFPALDNV